jgi:hypothetical protein
MSSPRDLGRKLADARRGAANPGGANDPLRFVRALIGDLVDKNLWPVALLLCVAIVAIPVLMTQSAGSHGGAGVPAAAPKPAVSATKAVELIGPRTVGTRTGAQRDPFRRPKKKQQAAAAAGSVALGADSPPAALPSAGAPSGGAPSTGTPSTGSPSAKATPKISPAKVYYRTAVRWSEAEGGATRPISRLTPLGDPGERAALYLGVTASGYALFLISPNASVKGVAGCDDVASCRGFGLKPGQKQFITVQPSDGGTARSYYLEVVSVKAVATSVAVARRMRAKVHSEGRAVMRAMWSDASTAQALSEVRYDATTGLVVVTSGAKKTTK